MGIWRYADCVVQPWSGNVHELVVVHEVQVQVHHAGESTLDVVS